MDIGHLGTADALIDPAHDVAQNALTVVVEFLRDGVGREIRLRQRQGDDVGELGLRAAREFLLAGEHIDLMIMQRVQGRRGWRGHPGRVGARARMTDLLNHHVGHAIGRGPHALADLRASGQPATQADVDVGVLVGRDPRGRLHVVLAHDRPGFHAGVDFIARAVEEARVDEGHPPRGGGDAGGEVARRAAFLVHDADLDRVGRQARQRLGARENVARQGHFLGAVHLRLDDVDRALARILDGARALDVVHGDQRCDGGVDNTLRRFLAVRPQHHVHEHVMADVARQHQAAAAEPQRLAIGSRVFAILVELAFDRLAVFLERRGERALHQAKPVAIDRDLVLGIDGRDRILHVHDGGNRRFDDQIGDPGGIGLADHVRAVDDDFEMQAVVAQQDMGGRRGVPAPAGELGGIGESGFRPARQRHHKGAIVDGVARRLRVAAAGERRRLIEHGARLGDDDGAAGGIVALAARGFARLGNGVRAVERVIETAPAGVGGVQRVARVRHRHDKLRPGYGGDLGIDVFGGDDAGGRFGQKIADLAQEGLVGRRVMGLALTRNVPRVDLRLKLVTEGEGRVNAWGQLGQHRGQPRPEGVR